MLSTRIITALLIVPVAVLGILFLPTAAVCIALGVLMLVGAWEWVRLLQLSDLVRLLFIAALGLLMIVLVATGYGVYGLEAVIVGLACLWWLIAIYWIPRFPTGWAPLMGRPDIGLLVGTIVLIAPVTAAAEIHGLEHGRWLLLTFFVLIWAADTGAFFAGRTFGRVKLAPNVSPGKTWAGAIGGVVGGLVVGAAAGGLLGFSAGRLAAFVVLAGLVAAMSIVGDLTISMFKRHAGVKDSGHLFPGHGGVLDRLDSLLAGMPWFYAGFYLVMLST